MSDVFMFTMFTRTQSIHQHELTRDTRRDEISRAASGLAHVTDFDAIIDYLGSSSGRVQYNVDAYLSGSAASTARYFVEFTE